LTAYFIDSLTYTTTSNLSKKIMGVLFIFRLLKHTLFIQPPYQER